MRFDASTNALLPLSAPAPFPQSSTKNSVSCTAWNQANGHSVRALYPCHTPQRVRQERHDDVIDLRLRVFETIHLCSLAQALSLQVPHCSLSTAFPTKECVSEMAARIGDSPRRCW
jgi:hypothetical protein